MRSTWGTLITDVDFGNEIDHILDIYRSYMGQVVNDVNFVKTGRLCHRYVHMSLRSLR